MKHTGKVALVTGAAQGIGLACAARLLAEGARVVVLDRDGPAAQAAAARLGNGAMAVTADLAGLTPDTARDIVAQVAARFGRLDVLVNNAGVSIGAVESSPSTAKMADIRATFDVNFFGLIAVTQAMVPLMKKSEAGRIVNLTSILGSLGEHRDPASPIYGMLYMAYNASKAAVNMFTANLAHELRETKIKVNAAHPGWVKTDMGGEAAPLETPEGAWTSVYLATLPAEGPSGGFYHKTVHMRW
jgi:NAD(P)-dependent dehydrogenase (short-subunit alcohol dehydrogenase family)